MNRPNYTMLMAHLADMPDPRSRRGRRYEWVFLLTMACAALLCGHRSVRGMAQWAWHNRHEILAALQPKRKNVPSASTLYRVLRRLDVEELEKRLSTFANAVDADDKVTGVVYGPGRTALRGQAIDGKEVRGANKQGKSLMLVSLVRHESAAVLGQHAVDRKTNEITVAPELLADCDLTGTVTTMDALLTQRQLAEQILAQNGDYLIAQRAQSAMVVKRNQPHLYEAIEFLFSTPPIPASADEYLRHSYTNDGHGRIETRTLESSTALNNYLDWPGVGQVLRRTRRSVNSKTGEVSEHINYAVTSLDRRRALPKQLEALWRAHWTIENNLHYVRDESMGEDRSTLRSDNAPHAMAALRNAVLTLLRYEGWTNIPDAFRYFATSTQNTLTLIGALET